MTAWWESFFDAEYFRIWGGFVGAEKTDKEAAGIWQMLSFSEGSRVLDAPCGYGRLSRALAARGAIVVGVDQSAALLEEAERQREGLSTERLRYHRHDLRVPLEETGFDAAINVFTSLGYGTEDDDLAILKTLCAAVRPGGLVMVETNHRDTVVAFFSRGGKPAHRLPDGTLVVEEPILDAVTGRVNTCWYWSGPGGAGKKEASLRLYTITELVQLADRAGLRLQSVHRGCSPEPFKCEGPEMGGRAAIVCVRP